MKLLPPLPQKSANSRLGPVVNYVNQGLSVKVFGLPGVGKTAAFHWLVNTPSLQHALGLQSKVEIFYEDLEQAISSAGRAHLIKQMQKNLSKLQKNRRCQIAYVLDSASTLKQSQEIQTIFFQNYQSFRPRLSFVYLFTNFYRNADLIEQIPLLKTSLGEASVFFPLFTPEETNHAVDQWQQITGVIFSPIQKKLIVSLGGGYAVLIKKLVFLLRENPKITTEGQILKEFPEITDIFNRLDNSFSDNQKQLLLTAADKKTGDNESDKTDFKILKKLGVFNQKSDLFSPLFTQYLVKIKKTKFNFKDSSFTDNLTASELNLFKALSRNQNQIVDRDTVAQAIWGNLWQEKYSDWAIDKIASHLRKKMAKDKDRKELVTIRGRGFRLSSSTT